MKNPQRANELINLIGSELVSHIAPDTTWTGLTFVSKIHPTGSAHFAYLYNETGSHPLSLKADAMFNLIQELNEASAEEEDGNWKAMRLQMAPDLRVQIQFDHQDANTWDIDPKNATGDIENLRPVFGEDDEPVSEEDIDLMLENLVPVVVSALKSGDAELIKDIPEQELKDMSWNALARGYLNGLLHPQDLVGFAMVSFEVAPNFDEHPAFQAAIEKAREKTGTILQGVLDSLEEKVWGEMDAAYNPDAWFSEFEEDETDA